MASPSIDLLCCMFRQNTTISSSTKRDVPNLVLGYVFFTTLFLSALVSVIGTAITLVPKRGVPRTRRDAVSDDRQRIILSWLAASDLIACVGVIVFAIFCMVEIQDYTSTVPTAGTITESLLCIIFTVWVQFFYLATYCWSFFYALDVYLMLKGVKWKFLFWVYFGVTWLLSAIIVASTVISVYDSKSETGKFECSTKFDKQHSKWLMWGSYCVLYIVFIAMPILYILSSRQISPMLKRGGVYTDRERKVKAQIKKKFLRIVVVFVICWAPNILNAAILGFQLSLDGKSWRNSRDIYVPLWLTMALLNPLQAFFNALVYWGPAGCTKVQTSQETSQQLETDSASYTGQLSGPTSLNATGTGEQTPLLRSMML